MTMTMLEKKLQRADLKQAVLYLFCNFISLMLISAYSAMMYSPTVLEVFPEGGDSRKQMMMIFALALFGCTVFTVYASGLFFRKKSRQLGILMALGASRRALAPGLFWEVITLSSLSSIDGVLAGIPFVYLLWNGFRLLVIDSEEMTLRLDPKYLIFAFLFAVVVILFSLVTANRYLRRTDIMDTICEEHKNEPVKEHGRWMGPAGFLLILIGAVMGYYAGRVYMALFMRYPNVLINLFYLPVVPGLYLVMLHTIVHGWSFRKKKSYKNLVARSMMKFQGRQTVNNLIVSTALIAGACFGIFFLPMLSMGQILSVNSRPYDYLYHYRSDQNTPSQAEIEALAADYDLTTSGWQQADYIFLGLDGTAQVEREDDSFYYEYMELIGGGIFFSESGYNRLTGQNLDVAPGTYMGISNEEETGTYWCKSGAGKLTNMVTRKVLPTAFAGYAHYEMLTTQAGSYVLDDADYTAIAEGLTEEWMGTYHAFNVNEKDNYQFANDFFLRFVGSFDKSCERPVYYDPVEKIVEEEKGEVYWGDTPRMTPVSFDQPNSSDFRNYWTYMPKFRILDQQDFMRTFAVFLMMFLFIFLICITAACIIGYTRCQTIALNNRYIFDDLKKLGAPPAYLKKEVRMQCRSVFQVPSVVGMSAMFVLYSLMLWANDNKFTASEFAGLSACAGVTILISLLIYGIYRQTVRILCRQLVIY